MATKSVYWVWERPDGYIAATKGATAPHGFKVFLESAEWGPAVERIIAERGASLRHQTLVASWEA